MKRKFMILFICMLFFIGLLGHLKCKKTEVSRENHLINESLIMGHEENSEMQAEYDEETSICEIVRAMDFTVNEPNLKITPQENQVYLEGYLKMLKNEIPVIGKAGEQYYKDLWKAGIEFEELLREKETREYPYLYYYDDLDGDGKPELAIEQGCMFLFKYDEESDKCRILYQEQACYFKKIVGAGQIWYHDGLHGDVIRDSLITLTDDGTFQVVLSLEEGINPKYPYYEVKVLNDALPDFVDISEENWNDITKPFFEMVENNGLPLKTLEEVFGELLEESDSEKEVIADLEDHTLLGHMWMYYEAEEIPFVDEETFAMIREAYGEVEYTAGFETGNPEVYEEYRQKFWRLLQSEVPFLNRKTGKEMYMKDWLEQREHDLERFTKYVFFDINGDGFPELCMDDGYAVVFAYDSDMDQYILWAIPNGKCIVGPRKFMWYPDYYTTICEFSQLDSDGDLELETLFWAVHEDLYHEDINMVMFPNYADKEKRWEITEEMKQNKSVV